MFAIVVEGNGRPRRRVTFQTSAEIGRSTRSDLVLPAEDVSRRHARIELDGNLYTLTDHGSTFGTFVDGVRVKQVDITGRERITMGPFAIAIESNAQPDATEERLLAAIAADDATSREVYADWLEQTGQLERAEFLRAQEALVGMAAEHAMFSHHAKRLRQLAASIEMSWRYLVARPAIENCGSRFNLRCPKEWSSLSPTERADVRHCGTCNSKVFYAATIQDARRYVESGRCVALDIIPLRSRGDLDPPRERPMMMGAVAPPDWNRRG